MAKRVKAPTPEVPMLHKDRHPVLRKDRRPVLREDRHMFRLGAFIIGAWRPTKDPQESSLTGEKQMRRGGNTFQKETAECWPTLLNLGISIARAMAKLELIA